MDDLTVMSTASRYDQRCGRCATPMPATPIYHVVSPGSPAPLITALLDGSINLVQCPRCEFLGRLLEPVGWVDLDREFVAVVHDPRDARESRSEACATILRSLPEWLTDDQRLVLTRRLLVVESFESLRSIIETDAATLERVLDADARRIRRRGTYGQERVDLLVADAEVRSMSLSQYEASEELLGPTEWWVGTAREQLRLALRSMTGLDPSSDVQGSERPLDPEGGLGGVPAVVGAEDERPPAGLDGIPWAAEGLTKQEALEAIAATLSSLGVDPHLIPGGEGGPALEVPFVLEIARQSVGRRRTEADAEGPARATDDGSNGRARYIAGMLDVFEPIVVNTAARVASLAEESAPTPDEGGGSGLEPGEAIITLGRSWTEGLVTSDARGFYDTSSRLNLHLIRVEPLPRDLEPILEALNEGRCEEAIERAELLEQTCAPDLRAVVRLWGAYAGMRSGHPGARLAMDGPMDEIQRRTDETGETSTVDLEALGVCAFAAGDILSAHEPEMAIAQFALAFELLGLTDQVFLQLQAGDHLAVALAHIDRRFEAGTVARGIVRDPRFEDVLSEARRRQLAWLAVAGFSPPIRLSLDASAGSMTMTLTSESMLGDIPSVNAALERGAGVLASVESGGQTTTFLLHNQFIDEVASRFPERPDPGLVEDMVHTLQLVEVAGVLPADLHDLAVSCLWIAMCRVQVPAISDDELAQCGLLLAHVCRTLVHVASTFDGDGSASGGHPAAETQGSTVPDDVMTWTCAMVAGRLATCLARWLVNDPPHGQGQRGSGFDVVLMESYPLALEVAGKRDEAIAVYRRYLPNWERQRSGLVLQDVQHRLQGIMGTGYVRLSRCLFAQFEETGDVLVALESADAIEWQRARTIQAAVFSSSLSNWREWLVHPMSTTASRLEPDEAVVCFAVHWQLDRIRGRWFTVGLTGGSERPWTDSLSPPDQLQGLHGWLLDRAITVADASDGVRSREELAAQVEQSVPVPEFERALRDLWALLGPVPPEVRRVWISTELYSLQLPWSAAAAVASDQEILVSVVPSTAVVRAAPSLADTVLPGNPRVVLLVDGDREVQRHGLALASALRSLSNRGARWEVVLCTDVAEAAAALSAPCEVLAVFGHGRQDAGIEEAITSLIAGSEVQVPRIVVLLACWSATLHQDERHHDVSGAPAALLMHGAYRVVGSIWPLWADAAQSLLRSFADELLAGATSDEAFLTAREAVRSAGPPFDHPAVWGAFTLFG